MDFIINSLFLFLNTVISLDLKKRNQNQLILKSENYRTKVYPLLKGNQKMNKKSRSVLYHYLSIQYHYTYQLICY